jgi:hypothetical protein
MRPLRLRPLACWRPLAAALLALGAWPAAAVEAPELKVAIVYNVLQFVAWPDDADPARAGKLVLCVDGSGLLAPVFRSLAGRPVQRRTLELLEPGDGADALKPCQALFLDATGRRAATLATRLPSAQPLLVIGDVPEGQPPAMVQLYEMGGRIAFNVDLAAARRSQLQVSSKLLRLAKQVTE